MVGVVRSHDDEDANLVEVDFHDSGTHHSFSLPNSLDHNMAALSSQALVLACPWTEDRPRYRRYLREKLPWVTEMGVVYC